MNTNLMKKAVIESAVSRGIRDMEEDPERSARRLADLGRQFAKNRFHDQVFSVIQELLDNEHSAYYDMIHNLLRNSDHNALKTFGINFGYMSWTCGASRIRLRQESDGFCIPWSITLRYDSSNSDGLDIKSLSRLMEEGQELGIFVYAIRQNGNDADSYTLLELLERYRDCAFIWYKDNGRLTAAQIQMLKVCQNTVVVLPVEDPETLLTCALLRDQKIVFGLSETYSDDTAGCVPGSPESILASETALYFMIPVDGSSASAVKACYDLRLRQEYPFLTIDLYGDQKSISNIITGHTHLLEIDQDGTVLQPSSHAGERFPADRPLAQVLKDIMPEWHS